MLFIREFVANLEDRYGWVRCEDADDERDFTHLSTEPMAGWSLLISLVTTVDNKDQYTRLHSEEVLYYAEQIALHLEIPFPEQQSLSIAALLHDVGKIGIPEHILKANHPLTLDERTIIRNHPTIGAALVEILGGQPDVATAIRHHHEAWDGSGYPDGLVGEDIPYFARILAVADAFSAMTSDRPYQKGKRHEEAKAILLSGAGQQWDPVCVQALLHCLADESGSLPAPSRAKAA
jgi:putative nucleotidyltransferase with HDIG domain